MTQSSECDMGNSALRAYPLLPWKGADLWSWGSDRSYLQAFLSRPHLSNREQLQKCLSALFQALYADSEEYCCYYYPVNMS